MDVLIKALQLIAALSLLVLVHEFGHFFFARLFKIRVEKFYLFFNWGFSLFKYKPKNSDTEYGIGWLPLGGYCKISGMIDESMDKESLKQEPQPWEFRSKPAWQRFFVMFGGVFFNIILAFIIYSVMLYTWGEEYLQTKDAVYGIACNNLAKEIGFKDGDMILAFDDVSVGTSDFTHLQIDLLRKSPEVITVLRNGDTTKFRFDDKFVSIMLKSRSLIFAPRVPFVVQSVPDTSQNASAGILPGDKVVALNGSAMNMVNDIQSYLGQHKNETVTAQMDRGDTTVNIPLSVNSQGLICVIPESPGFQITKKEYSLLASIPAGIKKSYTKVAEYVGDLGMIFSPKTEAYKSVGSVITMASIFPSTWIWYAFWNITALLSIMLAVLNMLPIPALDGGHIIFVLYEMITGKKPGDKFLEYAQIVGMVILFALMFLAFGNDILRLFNK